MSHWIDNKHSEYQEWHDRWIYSQDHYEAEVIDKANVYLQQRKQGESKDAFDERVSISDYLPLLGHVIDSLAGMLFAVEAKAERQWTEQEGDSLGSQEEEGTVAHALSRDSDGKGTDWVTKWKRFAIDVIVNQKLWVLIEGKTENRPHASVKIINPVDVPDWMEDKNGRITEAKVLDKMYDRDSIKEAPEESDGAFIYTLDGWEQHKRVEKVVAGQDGRQQVEISTEMVNFGFYHYEDKDGNRILPIYRVELPLRRYIAYILAKKNNAIFNKESAKDFLEWVACFPILNVFGDDELFKAVKQALTEGNRVLQNKPESTNAHAYTAPSTAPAERLSDSLKEKIEMFLFVAFQQFSDSAQEKTATEVRQDLSRGIGAFLELLRGTVDEAENNAFWRIEQVYFPAVSFQRNEDGEITSEQQLARNRQVWGQANVERSSDFMPIDIEKRIKEMAELFFGMGTVPLDKEAMVDAADSIAKHYNIEADRDELEKIIESKMARNTQRDDFTAGIDDIVNGS